MKATHWLSLSAIPALAFLFSPSIFAQTVAVSSIPDTLQVPTNQKLLLTVAATGDQIYVCQAEAEQPTRYEWTLKAPEALLYDDAGQTVGHHYGGPTWEMSDGSQVVGQLQTKVDAPTADAIPWLLLQVKSHQGDGILSQANWIQRINTVGGKAPVETCDSSHQNQEVRVDYSAAYYFYGDQ